MPELRQQKIGIGVNLKKGKEMDFNIMYNRPIDEFLERVPDAQGRIQNQVDWLNRAHPLPQQQQAQSSNPDYISQALRNSQRMVDIALPHIQELSPEEREAMTRKQLEARRLSTPTQHRSVGSFNPSNPFSLDTRGLSGAISHARARHVDGKNHEKLMDIAPQLADLSARDQAATQRATERAEMFSKTLPSERDDLRDRDRALSDLEAKHTREDEVLEKKNEFTERIENLRQEGRKEIEEIRNQNRIEISKISNESGSQGPIPVGSAQSMSRGYNEIATASTRTIQDLMQERNSINTNTEIGAAHAAEIDAHIDDLRREASIARQISFMLNDQRVQRSPMLRDAIREYERLASEGRTGEFDMSMLDKVYENYSSGESGESESGSSINDMLIDEYGTFFD